MPDQITFISDSKSKPFPGLLEARVGSVRGNSNWCQFNNKTYVKPNKSLTKEAVKSLVEGSISDIQECDFKRFSVSKAYELCSILRICASAQNMEKQLSGIIDVKSYINENIEGWGIARADIQITNLVNKQQLIFDIQLFHEEAGAKKRKV